MKETNQKYNVLTAEEERVIVYKGTEYPGTGKFNKHSEVGYYVCRRCDARLYRSEHKFDSGCGWPSFDKEIEGGKIVTKRDTTHGMIRTEILCGNCGSHLGHLFDDGPSESGLRYCVNSVSLDFHQR